MGETDRREDADDPGRERRPRERSPHERSPHERSPHERSPHELDQVDELERMRSPERDWVAPLDEEEREAATRDPRTPPARLEPYPGGERGDEASSEE